MSALEFLDTFCEPVSKFWWKGPNCHYNNETGNYSHCFDEVDFSLCFEDTAIFYGIVLFFWLLAVVQFLFGNGFRSRLRIGLLHTAKILLLVLLFVTAVIDLGYTIHQGVWQDEANPTVAEYQYLTPVVLALAMVVCLLVIHRHRLVGVRSSGIMFCFWLALVIYGAIKIRTLSLLATDNGGVEDVFRFVLFIIQFLLYFVQCVLSCIQEPKSKYSQIQDSDRTPCPEEDAPFLSQITWWWQNSQIWYGWRRPIKYDSLTDLLPDDKSAVVAPQFQEHWNTEIKKAGIKFYEAVTEEHVQYQSFDDSTEATVRLIPTEPHRQRTTDRKKDPSLVLALVKSFWKIFIAAAFFKLLNDCLAFVSPQLLKLMIGFTNDPNEPGWHGYMYAVLLFVAAVIQSLFLHQYFHRCFKMGMRVRTAIIAAVYNKSLRLSNRARRTSTVGEIVNLMSVDAQRFMDLCTFIHMLWSAPFQIILSLIFLYTTMGPSIFAGFAVMILMIPINALIASYSRKLQVKQMLFKDSRIKLVNEVLNGIKVIKLYAWEIPFKRLIGDIRVNELDVLKKTAYLNAVSAFTWTCAPFLVALATFATYTLVNLDNPDERLTADKAFVALSLFNILRFPLSMLPMLISQLVQVSVSVKRLRTFLKNDELDPNQITWNQEPAFGKEPSISMTNGTFSWEEESDANATLRGVNFEVAPGELVAVVGHVGAGKSSLIQALLGEMEKNSGQASIKGRVAYVPQQAWIQNATVKDNILFGKELNAMLYGKCISGCALGQDLEILPGGDMTEIGEKGINLSGGQKQRVSLARAVYQEADVYLLDDPLSAVDSHVGKHIFDKIIGPNGALQGKARVLVTHGVGFLPQCDKIVVLVDGKITEVGTYNELIESNGAFAEFLRNYSNVENPEEDDTTVAQDYSEFEEDQVMDEPRDIMSDTPFDDSERRQARRRHLARQSSKSREHLEDRASLGGLSRQSSTHSLKRQSSVQSLVKRQLSKQSLVHEKTPEKATETTALIKEEKAQEGTVKLSVVVAYIRACTLLMSVLTMLFYIATNAASVGSNFWLAEWSNAEGNASTAGSICDHPNYIDVGCYLGVYASLGFTQAAFVLLASFTLALAGIYASRTLHSGMLNNILRSPMSFFDTTPLGRILNRFSKDIYIIDEVVPRSLRSFLFTLFSVISTLIVIMIATPTFGIVIIPLGIFYVLVQRFYVATSRQLKRLESITRSPIYSHFQETITGASTIRAYRKQDVFMLQSQDKVDYNQIAYYPSICANRWLAIRLEFVGNLIIFFSALFAVIQRETGLLAITPGLVGLSISYALQVTQALNWVVRMTSELETNIVAVERTKEYAETPTEAPAIIQSRRPAPDWPTEGHVRFDNYSTRYREGLDLVLKNISAEIPGGTKVGIVGRTGAGKSSLTLALFRIIESASGAILIDNVDIAVFGLDDLRSRITIIPQDPVLFSGSLRVNLDPFDSHTDQEVWSALESAHLSTFVSGLEKGLQHDVAEGGENLSVGQRQLVCLARALLRKTKILVLDEATAAVDLETDNLIQKTIRSEFADCTVLTIAHRLNTIMDYDRVMVLDSGRISEYDTPASLLGNQGSLFYAMARDAGLA